MGKYPTSENLRFIYLVSPVVVVVLNLYIKLYLNDILDTQIRLQLEFVRTQKDSNKGTRQSAFSPYIKCKFGVEQIY